MTPVFTNDAIVLGLLMAVLAFVFYTSGKKTGFWAQFYKVVPALLMCYFLPALLAWPLGWISGEQSNLYFVASRYLLPASLILLTYEDCDDLDALRHDPALKIACDKRPDASIGLASQPTLSRLENAVSWRMLARMGLGMIDTFCDSYVRVPDRIVLDIDDTVDLAHGDQQLSLFSTHAGDTCFQPILIFEASTQKPVAAILRPGKRPSGEEAARVIGHVIRRIRRSKPSSVE